MTPHNAISIFAAATGDNSFGPWQLLLAFLSICASGAIWLSVRAYLASLVSKALSDDSFVARVSLLVKPDMVFDENGSVLSDRGACAFIKEGGIAITKGTDSTNATTLGMSVQIRIAFSKHLQTTPILTPIGPDAIYVTSTRGTAFDWIYTLTYVMRAGSPDGPHVNRTYRLEIV